MQTMMTNLKRLWRVNGYDGRQAQLKMAPLPRAIRRPDERSGSPRVGAVLVLLYPYHETTHLALTRRPDNLKDHSGQVSFPGGKVEPNESPTTAALRETWEELGIPPSQVEVLGELTPLYIPPTDFEVHPFVGWIPHRPNFTPNTAEVAELLEVSVDHLLQPTTRHKEPWHFGTYTMDVPFYDVQGHKVWGATAMMLSEFLGRWQLAFNTN
ncbi:MAG: CoA pyrophosphatase [Anaerolineae bacterium]|nr:CoA pyrophosphatase [Anaerolineae bacterium]MCO5195418.1 CoA pyrophosphatase [Anaerolineae bacterium]MCO5198752.1 CoA pyrophosphatase [Anaerolineae bacterium]